MSGVDAEGASPGGIVQPRQVLDKLPGTFQIVGTSDAPVFLLNEAQYQALVKAGVIAANGKEVKSRGKKAPPKKSKS